MASSILRKECPKCGKIAVETSRFKIGVSQMLRLACGHLMSYSVDKEADKSVYESLVFKDGCKPREYQIEAIKFIEASNFNCIIADEQGLGKTIEVGCALKLHPEKLLPAIITVPTTVKVQWYKELMRITDDPKKFLTQVIQNGKDKAIPGFKLYIVTFDMLKKDDIFADLDGDFFPKTLIIDECQRIKNHLSDRAKAVQRMAKKVQYVIPMSGTPIKNNAGEYFTVLNLVSQTRFPNYQRYLDNYCDYYNNGWGNKIGGLKNPAQFHLDTKDIIIRRTKDQVLKDLPPVERKFYHVELDAKLNKAYDNAMKELEQLFYEEMSEFERSSSTIAIMSRMRHICGASKVEECTDFVSEFLLSSDRKIVIFQHHQDVATMLEVKLKQWCQDGGFENPLMLTSQLNGDERANLVQKFKDGNHRILIASTLAAGEGLNLQFCSDAVILERQWNPANEEQAEARFHRFGQKNSVSVTYMVASGTIDEYFTELVEKKRSIVAATMDNKSIAWDQNSLMKELTETLIARGRKKWVL